MTRQRWATAALALLLIPAIASAGSVEIEHRCTVIYPNVWQYFAWKDCVKTATEQEREENLKRMKEEQARPCIVADISRMEGLAAKARGAVNSEWSLEEVQAALSPILGDQGEIDVPHDNIKDRVLIYSINTKCNASFHFLINVRAGPDQKLRWLRTWAIDPPAGYPENIHQEFSVDFEHQRQEERYRTESNKGDKGDKDMQAEIQASMAKEEQAREERHQMLLRNIKISNLKIKCVATDCFHGGLSTGPKTEAGRAGNWRRA